MKKKIVVSENMQEVRLAEGKKAGSESESGVERGARREM